MILPYLFSIPFSYPARGTSYLAMPGTTLPQSLKQIFICYQIINFEIYQNLVKNILWLSKLTFPKENGCKLLKGLRSIPFFGLDHLFFVNILLTNLLMLLQIWSCSNYFLLAANTQCPKGCGPRKRRHNCMLIGTLTHISPGPSCFFNMCLNFFLNFYMWRIEFINETFTKIIVLIFFTMMAKSLTHIVETTECITDSD